MAPRRSDLWQYVTVVTPATRTTGLKIVKCVFCLNDFKTNNATRIAAHLETCKFIEGDVNITKRRIEKKDKGKSVLPLIIASSPVSSEASTSSSGRTEFTEKYHKITDWARKLSETERKKCDADIALAFFSGGVPFRFIENPYLLRAMGLLRPNYVPSKRRQLSNHLLDNCYTNLQTQMNADISRATYLSLATDAWTNVNGESVINFIVLLPRPVFYEAVYTPDNPHTAKYLVEVTSEIIRKIGTHKVVSVVIDNARANASAAKTLQDTFKETPLTCVGCAAHWLNLLAKDITKLPVYKSALARAVQAIKTFTNKQVVSAKLDELQLQTYSRTIALQVPVETRWMTHCKALESLIDSKTALQQFCVHPELSGLLDGNKESDVKKDVLSDDFWVVVTELRTHLFPISGCILTLEKNSGKLHAVYNQFQILAQFYTTSELPNAADVLEAFKKRWSDYYEPAVAISHLLYPANAGRQEDPKLLEKAETFIREAFGDVHSRALISSLWCYLAKADGFDQKIFDVFVGDMSPVVWWSLGRFGSRHEGLRSLAMKVLHIPATSAAAERNWSAFRFIHTRLRNKLLAPRVKKLVYVFENTKPATDGPFDDGLENIVSLFDDDSE